MIEIKNVKKTFDKVQAVDGISLEIKEQTVFGLLGTNGAGKSTLMRMIAGVLKADKGSIKVDGQEIFDNPAAKSKCFYVSDDQFFYPNATVGDMERFYGIVYPKFDHEKFRNFVERFELPLRRKISTFSKGMKKQTSILLGVCSGTPYLLCDETFDGLDPVVRQGVKSIFANEMEERGLTPIIASHNLRELEDICDHIGLLHKGGVLLSKDLEELKCNIHRIQFVMEDYDHEKISRMFEILQYSNRGKLYSLTVRGEEEEILKKMESLHTVYSELLPLSLEEIFISETEVVGYDIKNIIS